MAVVIFRKKKFTKRKPKKDTQDSTFTEWNCFLCDGYIIRGIWWQPSYLMIIKTKACWIISFCSKQLKKMRFTINLSIIWCIITKSTRRQNQKWTINILNIFSNQKKVPITCSSVTQQKREEKQKDESLQLVIDDLNFHLQYIFFLKQYKTCRRFC